MQCREKFTLSLIHSEGKVATQDFAKQTSVYATALAFRRFSRLLDKLTLSLYMIKFYS